MPFNANQKDPIVLSINSLQGAGAERFVLTIGKAFSKLGFDVHILCFSSTVEYDIDDDLTYHLIDYQRYRWLPKGKIRHRILAHKVDAYICKNIGTPKLILSNLERSYRVFAHSQLPNIIYVIHNTLSLLYKFNESSEGQQVKEDFAQIFKTHPCVCVSQGAKEDFINNFGERTPIFAIHNPIDRESIVELADAFVPDYKDYIIHVGSFKEAKRHDLLIKAYAKTDRALPLLLLGKGRFQEDIEALVKTLGLESDVVFLGFHENPYPFIKHAAFKVLTSDWEGFALVIAEALALGVPVISTDCQSGPRELLPSANLMPKGDIDAIAAALTQAMEDPSQFSAEFDESLLPDVIAKQYLEVLQATTQ